MKERFPGQLRTKVKTIIEDHLGVQIKRASRHGLSECFDIRKSGCRISIVFDVGANNGGTASKFEVAFPKARIYCFEPVRATFETLKRNLKGHTNIACHNVAFGATEGQATVYLTGQSDTNSLVKPDTVVGQEVVEVCTVDGFSIRNPEIERIDLLKIDTEGFDLEVLKGAKDMLSAGKVSFVLTEVGFHPGDTRHVLFDDVRSYLLSMGFAVFGIYDQQLEWSGENRVRFANVCFSNENAFIFQ